MNMEVIRAGIPGHMGCPPPPFPSMMPGFGVERLRPPAMGGMGAAGPRGPPPALLPVPAAFPGFAPEPRLPPPCAPAPFTGFLFSQEDVDMILYGYARNKVNETLPGHALSGLRIGELSHGPPSFLGMCMPPPAAVGGISPHMTAHVAMSAIYQGLRNRTTRKGIDRILGGGGSPHGPHGHHMPPVSHPPLKASAGPIDPSTLDLPEGIEIFSTTFAGALHYGVFCKKTVIPKGTRFGPFQGRLVNTSEIKSHDDNSHMWEIFAEGKLSHFVDGRGSAGNWMAYVNCARYAQEQNLIAVQVDGAIFYEACKDIPQGTELLVWYGDSYLQFMGIPVALKEMADGTQQEEVECSEGYTCERCGKVFAYKYYRDKHLKYTRCVDQGDRKFPCHLCTRSFEKRDRLRIHILHVHEKHRPHKCTVCGKSFSQSSSLNKHMRVHSGERPYKCVYCSKAFTASSILRTHIRQHSGEKPFKCKHCGKAFASHAAHDSHVRRTHTKDRVSCTVCGKIFSQPQELSFHMTIHHGNKGFVHENNHNLFSSPDSRDLMRADVMLSSGSAGSDDISGDESLASFGLRHDINMNDKLNDPIDVVGLEAEPLAVV